jgi:UPF0716 protein FxsA
VTLRMRALVLGYPLVELITAYAVAQWIGWGWTILLLIVGFPIGFAIMRNAGQAAMVDLQKAATTGGEPDQGRHAVTLFGGLLVAVPGFWTDLIGLLLILPPVQGLVRHRAQRWLDARMSTLRMPGVYTPQGFGSGDIVQGTVIHVEDLRDTDPEPPRELG